jgi:Glyoxalase-like domain
VCKACRPFVVKKIFVLIALGYELEPPSGGFATWDGWRRDIGLPEGYMRTGADSIIDPDGGGPRIWFQVVPDGKTVTNRLHLDVYASGGRSLPLAERGRRVDAEAQRLADLGATMVGAGWRRVAQIRENRISVSAEPPQGPLARQDATGSDSAESLTAYHRPDFQR